MSEDPGRLNALLGALFNGGLRAGFRAATSDGQGAFLAAMILFGISAYAFHYGLLPQTERERRLEEVAGDKQESLEGERYPILASVVTPRNESILCRDEGRALRDALRTAYATFASRAAELYDASPRDAAPKDASPVAAPPADALSKGAPATGGAAGDATAAPVDDGPGADGPGKDGSAKDGSAKDGSAKDGSAKDGSAKDGSAKDGPPLYSLKPVCASRTINIGPAWTEVQDVPRARESTLFIPSTIALRANLACPDVCSAQSTCADRAVASLSSEFQHVLSTSQAIENLDYAAIESGLAAALPPGPGPGPAPQSASYFISPEGISRVVPAFFVDDILAHYMGNSASYFSNALQRVGQGDACSALRPPGSTASDKLEGVVTSPYLDMFGGGLVETFCAPIDVVHGRAAPRAKTTIGVLCTDVYQPEAAVIRGLVDVSAALDLTVVRIWKPADADQRPPSAGDPQDGRRSGRRMRDLQVTPCSAIPGCSSKLKPFGNWSELRLFATLYYNKLSNRHSLRPGGVFVDGDDSDAKFAVAVYRSDQYWDLAIGRLRQPGRRDYAALVLSGLCIFIAIAILGFGYRHKMRRREAYLARGLAYGLLRVGPLDNIIGGNDRAESVLNVGLPRLGVYSSRVTIRNTFSGFIDYLKCVLIPISGTLNQRCVINYDQIRRRSIDGLTTDFYAFLKSRTWIRVSTRIVVLPNKQEDLFYAIDTHICEEHAVFLRSLHG